MPEDRRTDDVETFLAAQKAMADRKQGLIEDLLKQRDAEMQEFDEKLAMLGYRSNSSKSKRSHHKPAPSRAAAD